MPSSSSEVTNRLVPGAPQKAHVVFLHEGAGHGVQTAEGLVHHHDLRLVDHGADQFGAALHTARGCEGYLLRKSSRPTISSSFMVVFSRSLPLSSPRTRAVRDVFEHGHPREQRGLLKHDQTVGSGPETFSPSMRDAARVGRLIARQHVDERRLAAARRPDEDGELAFSSVKEQSLMTSLCRGRCRSLCRGRRSAFRRIPYRCRSWSPLFRMYAATGSCGRPRSG